MSLGGNRFQTVFTYNDNGDPADDFHEGARSASFVYYTAEGEILPRPTGAAAGTRAARARVEIVELLVHEGFRLQRDGTSQSMIENMLGCHERNEVIATP
jgi:hypothetical protein